MLKFIKGHLTSIAGIEIYPIISFLIFFTFFVVVTIWVFGRKKDYFTKLGNIPFDNDNLKQN